MSHFQRFLEYNFNLGFHHLMELYIRFPDKFSKKEWHDE